MAPGTRSSKRKRPATETEDKRGKRKTGGALEGESSAPVDAGKPQKPTGHPFINEEVDWTYVRINLLGHAKKVIPTGYEGLAGEVNNVLKTLSIPQADKVRNSAMGQFTRLDKNSTRSGNMLHYVVCHQVIPEPNFDPTALFFKIGGKVVRFSRAEYALISGLKFGPANFNPYTKHEIPPDSIFKRLFGGNQGTRLCDVRGAYTTNKFKVNGKKVRATAEDFVKLSKFMLCLGFALGFDGSKKKIPSWLWVLLENKDEWETFPWGSISYQLLVEGIKGIPLKAKGNARLNYTVKGNTIAFSAWIFEAIPAFGEILGLKKELWQIPRFMRYSFVKERGYPTEEQITQEADFTDTQINQVFDSLPILTVIQPPTDVQTEPLRVRPLRIVYPARQVRSPFLRDDVRPAHNQFDTFLKKGKQKRNVGLPENVDRLFFRQIMNEKGLIMEDHVNSYLAVLVSNPTLAGFTHLKPNVGVTSTFFMCEVESVFESLHKNEKLATGMFNYESFDPSVEEVVPPKDMEKLLIFADGSYPPWGEHIKDWSEFEKEKWATVVIDIPNQQLIIHDPKSFKFTEADEYDRLNTFLPMARLVPQLLKTIGCFEKWNIRNPQYGQWEITFGERTGRDAFREKNEADSALYCMRYIEKMVARGGDSIHTLRNNEEIKAYRYHVAKTIYYNSTEPTSVQMMLDAIQL